MTGGGIFPPTVTNQPESFTVFVNERPVLVPPGASAHGAVRLADPALADRLATGEAVLGDARGLPVDPGTPLEPGVILRVVVSARRTGADAHS